MISTRTLTYSRWLPHRILKHSCTTKPSKPNSSSNILTHSTKATIRDRTWVCTTCSHNTVNREYIPEPITTGFAAAMATIPVSWDQIL